MPVDKTQRKLFLSPFEWKARHSSAPVRKYHNTLNTILRRASKATINIKEAGNDVLKRPIRAEKGWAMKRAHPSKKV